MHVIEKMAERAEKLQETIKAKNSKALGRQLIAGARENADYDLSSGPRWSMQWYVNFVKELESRV